jgi:hypothetical protein
MIQSIGKYLIILGLIIFLGGVALTFFPKLNFFGKLPGDISIKGGNSSFYFPVVTCIVISVVLTLVFWLVNYFFKK